MSSLPIESVWDYPRPPKLEPFKGHIRIVHQGEILVDSNRAMRILETSHPPTYYIPTADIKMHFLRTSDQNRTFCEYKGHASYYDLAFPNALVTQVAWHYPDPSKRYLALLDHLAFYASKVDECYVNDERVNAQEGDFYGGWMTSNLRGPFKGAVGTWGW